MTGLSLEVKKPCGPDNGPASKWSSFSGPRRSSRNARTGLLTMRVLVAGLMEFSRNTEFGGSACLLLIFLPPLWRYENEQLPVDTAGTHVSLFWKHAAANSTRPVLFGPRWVSG